VKFQYDKLLWRKRKLHLDLD